MVGKTSRYSWCALNPAMTKLANRKAATQREMGITEIVKATSNKHARCQRRRLLCQITSASAQPRQMRPKSGIESLNVSTQAKVFR